MFIQIDKQTLFIKNGGNKSFSYKTKASMSFILMRTMSLQFLIMKRKKIITWICIYLNWQMNLDSKEWWKEKLFLRNQNINSFIPMSKMNSWFPIMQRKEIIYWICVHPNWQKNFGSKKWWKKKLFYETKTSNHLSQWVEWVYGSQSRKERDCYVNSCLPYLIDELWF